MRRRVKDEFPLRRQCLTGAPSTANAFRWRFRAGFAESVLTLCGEMSSGQPLHVILREWRDPWLNIAGFVIDDSGVLIFSTNTWNQPAIITPRFAREAILHGLASGWRPHERGGKLFCIYESEKWSELSPCRTKAIPNAI